MATATASKSASRTPAARKSAATKRASRRSAVNHTSNTVKENTTVPTVKTTRKPAAKTTAAKPTTVTVIFDRGPEPKSTGGQRFNERGKEGSLVMRTLYLDQKTDKKLGKPQAIEATVKAL